MADSAIHDAPEAPKALEYLKSILVRDETVEAWAMQRRLFALLHRRLMIAATTNRLIALTRGLIGGFRYTDLRWQDLKEAHVSVGIVGATLRLLAEGQSDLASAQRADRVLVYSGLDPAQAQSVYRICQTQDQAWREKRRIREIEEMRARSGGVQIGGSGAGVLARWRVRGRDAAPRAGPPDARHQAHLGRRVRGDQGQDPERAVAVSARRPAVRRVSARHADRARAPR